jgi:hypothetical protein
MTKFCKWKASKVLHNYVAPVVGTYASSLTRFNITWTFDKPYQYGEYANGDYWVKGPVTIIETNPPCAVNESYIRNGAMINPDPNYLYGVPYASYFRQGYDSEIPAGEYFYDSALNAIRPDGNDLSEDNPATIPVNSSLVTAISSYLHGVSQQPYLQEVEILTVVDAIPSEGDFRPSFVGTNKASQYNISDLNYAALPSLTKPSTNVPLMSTIEEYFARPWPDYIRTHVTRELLALNNCQWYGREYVNESVPGALMLCLDFTNSEKETLLIRYIQLGLDLYGSFKGGCSWEISGGWMMGRKLPIIFTGLVLNSSAILTDMGIHSVTGYGGQGETRTVIPFHEDGIFYVTQTEVNQAHSVPSGSSNQVVANYTSGDIGLPDWGQQHIVNPQYDNAYWHADYRHLCNRSDVGTALTALLLGVKTTWNWQAFFDYIDRYMEIEEGVNDTVWQGYEGGFGSLLVKRMWELYRSDYNPRYSPDNPTATAISSSRIDLTWTYTSTGLADITNFRIQRSSNGGSTYTEVTTIVKQDGTYSYSYSNTGLTTGTEYHYWIRAYNALGDSYPAICYATTS